MVLVLMDALAMQLNIQASLTYIYILLANIATGHTAFEECPCRR